jgi:hypothetical protein
VYSVFTYLLKYFRSMDVKKPGVPKVAPVLFLPCSIQLSRYHTATLTIFAFLSDAMRIQRNQNFEIGDFRTCALKKYVVLLITSLFINRSLPFFSQMFFVSLSTICVLHPIWNWSPFSRWVALDVVGNDNSIILRTPATSLWQRPLHELQNRLASYPSSFYPF